MDLSEYLNSEQLAPAEDREGAILVTAGAGSGKTRLLTYRIAGILESGVSPFSILAITFTNKAAKEMQTRLEGITPRAGDIWVSTFHSMCAKILRVHAVKLGYTSSFTIYDTEDTVKLLKKICKEFEIEDDKFYKTAGEVIADAKNRGLSAATWAAMPSLYNNKDDLARVFAEYEDRMFKSNAMDFDDLLIKCYTLLMTDETALRQYQTKFRYILVDEFQDTNKIQYELVKLLSGGYGNVFVVGDEDQSIYSWRGADFTNMKRFINEFGAKVYKLEQNYRSSGNILKAANNLIKNNTSRIPKVLWTDKNPGESITVGNPVTDLDEADYVARKIMAMCAGGRGYRDFAVLLRVNALTRLVEQRFMAYGIPYKIYGGFRFFDRKEVKDIIAYLRTVVNPNDEEALDRIINFPRRKIGDAALAQLKAYARLNGLSVAETILNIENNEDLPNSVVNKFRPFAVLLKELINDSKEKSLSGFVNAVFEKSGIKMLYSMEDSEENRDRLMNIGQLISYAAEFEKRGLYSTDMFLQEVSLYSEGDNADENSVFISTIHSAKGMEFDTVFVIGCEDGIIPLSRSAHDEDSSEEERRLMYVALTRAKRKLFLTYTQQRTLYGMVKLSLISPFMTEIDPSLKPKPRKGAVYGSSDDAESYGYPLGNSAPAAPKIVSPVAKPPEKKQKDVSAFAPGTRVRHRRFGKGTVVDITGSNANPYVRINFDTIGTMQLALNFAPLEIVDDE